MSTSNPTDIYIVRRTPRWPVRLDPVGPPTLRKVARATTPSTTEPTMEPDTITNMEQGLSMAYHTAVRPLTDEEYALLKEDIAKRGIISPIIKDAAGNIVDGFHRNKIAEELGLTDIPIKQVDGTEAELQAMAIALNVARRQLDAEDRRELVAQLRAEGKSTRQIAEQIGVDQSTVVRDLAKASDATASVDRVTGKDGKSRPARMTRKTTPERNAEKRAERAAKRGNPAQPVAADAPAPAAEPKPAAEEPKAPSEAPKVVAVDDLDTWIDLRPALPMSDLFAALWGRMSGIDKLNVQAFLSAEMKKFETTDRPAALNGAAS